MASTAAKADAVREEYEDACNKVEAIKVCGEGILLLLKKKKKKFDIIIFALMN